MKFALPTLLSLLTLSAAAPSALSAKNYYLKTSVKPNQANKSQYNNLYLSAYHSGAGENDAVLLPNKSTAAPGILVKTNATSVNGHAFYNQILTLGQYNYSLIPIPDEDFYAAWQPTAINIGDGINPTASGFWLNSTGLQWTTQPGQKGTGIFDGWLVCDWFRGVPQLFFLVTGEDRNVAIPSSCAKVNLVPEYLSTPTPPPYGS